MKETPPERTYDALVNTLVISFLVPGILLAASFALQQFSNGSPYAEVFQDATTISSWLILVLGISFALKRLRTFNRQMQKNPQEFIRYFEEP